MIGHLFSQSLEISTEFGGGSAGSHSSESSFSPVIKTSGSKHPTNSSASEKHIIRAKILQNLDFYSLLNAIHVCQLWNKIGCSVLEKRRLKFDLVNFKLEHNEADKMEAYNHKGEHKIKDFSELIDHENSCCFCFFNDEMEHNPISFGSENAQMKGSEYLRKYLKNKKCQKIYIPTYEVIGTNLNPVNTRIDSHFLTNQERKLQEKLNEKSGIFEFSNVSASGSKTLSLNNVQPNTINEVESQHFNTFSESPRKSEKLSWKKRFDFNSVGESSDFIDLSAEIDRFGLRLSFLNIPKQNRAEIRFVNLDDSADMIKHRLSAHKSDHSGLKNEEFDFLCDIKAKEHLKAFFLFTTKKTSYIKALARKAQTRYNNRIAIGGGLLEATPRLNDTYVKNLGVCISGDNVCTASVIIPSTCRKNETLETYMKKLKDLKMPESHSVCFMFSCCGKGPGWYKDEHETEEESHSIEVKAFRKYFPVTPVVGFYGNGEIGNNFLETYDDLMESCDDSGEKSKESLEKCDNSLGHSKNSVGVQSDFGLSKETQTLPNKKRKIASEKLFHQYSTVFVLVSFL